MKFHRRLFQWLVFLLPLQLGRHFWPGWAYLWGLRIDYLSPTLYLTDLLVMAILLFWWGEKIKGRRRLSIALEAIKTKNWRALLLPAAFFSFLLVNVWLAANSAAALYKLGKVVEFALLGFYVAQTGFSPEIIVFPLLGAVVYSALLAWGQFWQQASLGGVFWWLGERTFNRTTPGIARAIIGGRLVLRPYATFSHPNVLAGFILVSSILVFPYLRRKWLVVGYWFLAVVTIGLTFSRSAWLVGLLVLAVSFWRSTQRKKTGRWWFLFLFCLIGAFYFARGLSGPAAVEERLQLNKVAWLMIKHFPLVGVGLNNFIVRLPEFGGVSETVRFLQPVHNLFLLVAAETGLVGFLIFLWFLFLTFKRLSGRTGLALGLAAILVLGLFDHYWLTLQQSQLLLAIVLGLSWAKGKPAC